MVAAFFWACRDVASKVIEARGLGPWNILAVCSFFALLLNVMAMLGKQCAGFGCTEKLPWQTQGWVAARCVGATVGMVGNLIAVKELSLGIASMIHCTSPIFVILLSRLLLRERISPLAAGCMLIAVVGLTLQIQPWHQRSQAEGGGSIFGYVCAFVSVIGAAASYTSLRALREISATTSLFALYLTGLATGMVMTMQVGAAPLPLNMWGLLFLLALIIFSAEALLTKGYAWATDAASVAGYKYLTPVFAMGFNFYLTGIIPTPLTLVGACLVLASSALMVSARGPPAGAVDEGLQASASSSDMDSNALAADSNSAASTCIDGSDCELGDCQGQDKANPKEAA